MHLLFWPNSQALTRLSLCLQPYVSQSLACVTVLKWPHVLWTFWRHHGHFAEECRLDRDTVNYVPYSLWTLCVGSWMSYRSYEQGLGDRTYGLLFLSKETRKSNQLQNDVIKKKGPECWSGTVVWCSTNWANQLAVNYFDFVTWYWIKCPWSAGLVL